MIALRRALVVLAAAGAAVGIIEALLVSQSSVGSPRGLWITLIFVIGWGFIGVGLFAWWRRPESGVGLLMVATGFAWYLSVFSEIDIPIFYSLGVVLGSVFAITAIHLLLSFPTGRLGSGRDRKAVIFGYGLTPAGLLPVALFSQASELGCDSGCPSNPLQISDNFEVARVSLIALDAVGVLFLGYVAYLLVRRLRAATPPERRLLAPLYFTGTTLLVLLAALLVTQVLALSEISAPDHGIYQVIAYSALVPFGLMPFVFLAGLAKTRITRGGAVGRLVEGLGASPGPGRVRNALADALGDPSLDLAYWVTGAERWVDSRGLPYLLPPPESGRAVTPVELEGRRVAAIVHDPSLDEDRQMVRAAGSTAALALENERLEAELRAKVEELRTSRERLIEVGLTERRALERNLHDGAQQRLVSLALQLRMARTALDADPDGAARTLEAASGELDQALGELRELARGIHPAVLSDRGLPAALEGLARRSPLPVRVESLPAERLPAPVELAAYYVVSEALTNVVKYAHASHAEVQVARDNGRVTVQVADDGVGGADPVRGTGLRGLADRVDALDGRFEVDSEEGRGTIVRARIPCG